MSNHLETVAVDFSKTKNRNRSRAALVACALLLGIGWMAPIRGEAQTPVSPSPSALRVAPRPDGQPARRTAPRPDPLRTAKLLQSVAMGDFNGDGIMDFAVADFLSDNILVMLGDGEGHFRLAAKLPAGGGPRSIVAGDFNHDGVMDLAVANFFSGDVSIFIGRGDGSFADPYPIHLAPGLSSLAVANFDSGGSLDLVAANFLSGALTVLTVLKGSPEGSFEVEATLGPATAVSLVYVQDFNGDGHQDLIAVDASEKHAWMFAGNGHGGFQPGQPGQSIDPQLAASRLATPPRATAATAALSQLPAPAQIIVQTIVKTAGDGQLAHPGSVLLANLVAAVTGPKGGPVGAGTQEPVFFSSLYGGASVRGPSPASTNGEGQASAQVAVSALPGINFVAASAAGGAAVAFGEASALKPADFFKQVESALFPPPLTPASLPLRQLLNQAQDQLNKNDVVGAVVTLENCLELLAPAEPQPGTGPTAPSAAVDLLKRLLNQVVLFGRNLGDYTGTISCGQTIGGQVFPEQYDSYEFSANAGDVIMYAIVGWTDDWACADVGWGSGACQGPSAPFTIPTTGTYTLSVDAGNAWDCDFSPCAYTLNLQFLTGQCATSISCGQTQSGALDIAQQDAYIFSANAGEAVTWASVATPPPFGGDSLNACADLYASGSYTGYTTCNTNIGPFPISKTGNYVFVVHAADYGLVWSHGDYNLNLQFTTGRCATSTGCGQTKSGTLVTAQQDAYSFSAQAGQVITFGSQATSNTNSLSACADLYNASGKKVASDPCNGVSAAFTIPTFGSYTFLVHDASYYNSGNYNANWQFTAGCPAGPAVALSAGGLNCGTQVLNTSSTPKTVTFANTGIQALTVNGITNQGANPGDFALNTNCGNSVAPGANCSVGVTFTPTGTGTRKTVLTINDNAPGAPHHVLLTGVGTAVSLQPASLNLGNQKVGTTSSSQQITVTNKGSATIEFFAIALGGANPKDFSQSGTCGSTLAPAASCTINVTFTPAKTGSRTASVLFSDNGGGNLQSVGLSGTGQ
ncbi:MAG: choice-of-anchor D domain-containing protein [Terriglobia bacterium]